MGIFNRLFQRLFNKHMTNYKDEVKCWNNLKLTLREKLKEKEGDKIKCAREMVRVAILEIEKIITKHRQDVLSGKDEKKGLTRLYFNLNESGTLENQINVLMNGMGTGRNSGWDSDLKKIFKDLKKQVDDYKIANNKKDQVGNERTTINKISDFINSVSNIGEVGLGSEQKIKEAEDYYNQLGTENANLSKEQLNKISENYNKLKEKRIAFEKLKLIDQFIKLVSDVGEVSLDSEDKIKQAEQYHKNLDFDYKYLSEEQIVKFQENHNKLIEKRKAFDELKLIDQFINSVSDVGEVSLDSEEKIKEAENCYTKLKGLDLNNRVSDSHKKLLEAREKIGKLKEEIKQLKNDCTQAKTNILKGDTWKELDVEKFKSDRYDKLTHDQKKAVQKEFDELYSLKNVYQFNCLAKQADNSLVLDHKEDITKAYYFYKNKLSDEQKEYKIIKEKYYTVNYYFNKIKPSEEKAQKFNNLVNEIEKDFCLNIEEKIKEAEKMYNELIWYSTKLFEESYNKLSGLKKQFEILRPVKVFIESVNGIGDIKNVNLESEKSIQEAEAFYEKLDVKLKKREDVNKNHDKLVEARKKLGKLKVESFVKSLGDIGDIEKISLESEESIKKAEEIYGKLGNEQRKDKSVTENYKKFVEVRDKFTAVKNIDVFINSVKSVGNKVSLESETKINEAFLNYSKLNKDQKENKEVETSVVELAKLKEGLTVLKKPGEFIKLVTKIKNIDLSSKKDIDGAENSYKRLSGEQQKQNEVVQSKNKLDKFKNELERLKNEIKEFENSVKTVVENVNSENMSLNYGEDIHKLIEQYDNKFTKEQKEDVDVKYSYQELLKADEKVRMIENPAHTFNNFVVTKLTTPYDLEKKPVIEQAENYYVIVKNAIESGTIKGNIVAESVKRLEEAKKQCLELEGNEKNVEKIKDQLKQIKNKLKNLSNFQSDKDGKFDEEKFRDKLLEGFWLCWKNDKYLNAALKNENEINSELKVPLKEESAKFLLENNNTFWYSSISRNYLFFMVSMIKCKEQYIELSKEKEITYDDPTNYRVNEEYTKAWTDLTEEIKSFTYEEKNLLNSLQNISKIKIKYEIDNKSKSQTIDRPNSDKISILRRTYGYLCPKDENNITSMIDKLGQLEDKNFDKYFVQSIKKVIECADERVKTENAGKLIIMALKVAVSDVEEQSRLKECKLPMWKIANDKPSVSRDDLHQGDLGDCWLISSLISIVDKNPNDILECFPNKDEEIDIDGKIKGNDITVRLYRVMVHAHRKFNGRIRAYARPLCPVDIKMKSTIYKAGNDAKVAWPKFIEKAVSVYRFKKLAVVDKSLGNFGEKLLDSAEQWWTKKGEGHQALTSGYTDGIVMAMILGTTGGGTDYNYDIGDKVVTDSFYKYLKENLKNFKNKKATVSFRKIFEVNGKLITTQHAYSLDDVSENSVSITNPWNSSDEGKKKWSNKVTIPFETFCKYCKNIESSNSRKKKS